MKYLKKSNQVLFRFQKKTKVYKQGKFCRKFAYFLICEKKESFKYLIPPPLFPFQP